MDNSVGIEEMRMAKLKTEEAVAKAREAEMKINRLEEYNNMLKEEKDKREKFLEERFNLSEANVQSMRATNAKLEVAFEAQKKQTEDATMVSSSLRITLKWNCFQQVDSLLKDLEQVRRDNDKLKLEDGDKLGKIRQLNEAIAAAQQEVSSLKWVDGEFGILHVLWLESCARSDNLLMIELIKIGLIWTTPLIKT